MRRPRLRKAVVHVRPERVQRDATRRALLRLRVRDLRAAQTPADPDLHALAAGAHGALNRLANRPTVANPPLNLVGNIVRYELRIEFRTLDLLDRQMHLAPDCLVDLLVQPVDAAPRAPDHNARLRRPDDHRHRVRVAVDGHLAHRRVPQPLLDDVTDPYILDELVPVSLVLGKPPA